MYGHVKTFARAAVLCTGLSLFISPAVLAQDQDHHEGDQDHRAAQQRDYGNNQYANNQFYQVGQREGDEDRQRNHQRKSHHHKYTSDEDRRAHDAGYQNGWQGNSREHDDNENHPH